MLRSTFYEAEQSWADKIRERRLLQHRFDVLFRSLSALKTQLPSQSSSNQTELAALLSEQKTSVESVFSSIQASSTVLKDKIVKQYEPSVTMTIERYVPSSPIIIEGWTYDAKAMIYTLDLSAPVSPAYLPTKNDTLVIGSNTFFMQSLNATPPSLFVSGHSEPVTGSKLTVIYIKSLLPNARIIEIEGTFEPEVDGAPSVIPICLQKADSDIEPRITIVNKIQAKNSDDGIILIPQVGDTIDNDTQYMFSSDKDYFSTTSIISTKKNSYYSTL